MAREEGGGGAGLPACLFRGAEGAVGPGSAMPGGCGFGGKSLTLSVGAGSILCEAMVLVIVMAVLGRVFTTRPALR